MTASNSRAKTPGDTKKTPSLSRPHPLECLANGSPGQEPPSLLKRETKAGERERDRERLLLCEQRCGNQEALLLQEEGRRKIR